MAVAGKNGKVVIGEGSTEKVFGMKNWSLELSLETLETTALGDYGVPTDTKGQKALQDAFLNGTTVKVKMYVDATNYYQGDAYISSLSIEDPVDDVVSISIEFTGTGALSFETGAAA